MKRLLGPLLFTLPLVMGAGWLLSRSAEAREVTGEAFWALFGFFTTPFVLETSVAVVGLITVLTYNQWRQEKDGAEWVEMEVPDAASATRTEEG